MMTQPTEKDLLAVFRKNLWHLESYEAFAEKTEVFKTFFNEVESGYHGNNNVPLESFLSSIDNAVSAVSNLLDLVKTELDAQKDAKISKNAELRNAAIELAACVNQGNLQVLEDVVDLIGDYYNTTLAFGIEYQGKELAQSMNIEDASFDLTAALGEVYAFAVDFGYEAEKEADLEEEPERE